jgi:predicted  nucleic acid-binding Zn-ribbon protein
MQGDSFCVNPIEEFVNLGVKTTKIQSSDLHVTMKSSRLIEGEDYSELRSAPELRKQGGTSTKKIYLLKPKSFKKLLLDINDHKQRIKFRDYYILLEECVAYYDSYQMKLLDKCIKYLESLNNDKDCKIDKQSNKIDKLIKTVETQSIKINKLLKYGASTDKKLDTVNIELTGVNIELTGVKTELTGVKTELTGVKTELTGVKTELTGVKTELTGVKVELSEVKAKLNDLMSKYYNKQFEYNSDNILDSKCIKVFEIIDPDEEYYSYYTIMYCSINNLYDCISSKLDRNARDSNNRIDFTRFRLVEIYKPMNDSVYVIQNLTNMLKDYCTNVNMRYDKNDSKYNGSSRTIKIVHTHEQRVLRLIKKQFEDMYLANLNAIDPNEQEHAILNEFFQTPYMNSVRQVITNILTDHVILKNNILLNEVRTNLLTLN